MDGDIDNTIPSKPLSCDSCRARKIRCDREVPCSSCRAWKITCTTTLRPRERKQRVLISHKYENEFRDLNKKLENLSVTLQSFVDNAKPGDPGSSALHSQVAEVLATVKREPDDDSPLFHGESSFPAQWKDVAQAYGNEITDSPPNSDRSGPMSAAIDLERLPLKSSFSRDSPGPLNAENLASNFPQLAHLPLPPTASVLNVLRIAKVYPQNVFKNFYFISIERVTISSQKLFFATEDYTLATFVVVNSYLTYLFRDMEKHVAEKISMTKEDQYKFAEMCSANVCTAMKLWNLAVEPSYDNIEALMLGCFILMEESYMFRAFTCVGFLIRLLQDAGFHRQSSLEGLSTEERRHRKWLFWTAYSFNNVLSLNFGRTSNIRDWDITVERPDFPPEAEVHGKQILFWIDLAQLHSQIYEKLFSAHGLAASQGVRTAFAQEFAAVAHKLREDFHPYYLQLRVHSDFEAASAASQVVLWSTLTMIYKCIPPSSTTIGSAPRLLQFSDDCITAARRTLEVLNEAWEEIEISGSESWRIFIHWCLVGSPFLPFLVVFAKTMNKPNSIEDYQLLAKTGRTIDTAASRSKGLAKLNDICQNFLKVVTARYKPITQPVPPEAHHVNLLQQPMEMLPQQLPLPDDIGFNYSDPTAFNFMDFSMLDGWELGPGVAESAREMNSYFEQLPQNSFLGPSG